MSRQKVEDKMLGELGFKEEKKTRFEGGPIGYEGVYHGARSYPSSPPRSSLRGGGVAPRPSVPLGGMKELERRDYKKVAVAGRGEFFADWCDRVGWRWLDMCDATGTEYYEEVRSWFLRQKTELYQTGGKK